jgi:glycosyltransferase involved in cell wall biosynthesis
VDRCLWEHPVRVLVFEPDHNGHHFSYLSLILPAVAALAPRPVLVISKGAPETEPYRLLIRPLAGAVELDAACAAPAGSAWEIAQRRAVDLLSAIERHRPDHVVVPYADGLGQVLALRGLSGRRVFRQGVSSEALFMRGAFAYPSAGVKRRLAQSVNRVLMERSPFGCRHHLDPLVYERLRPGRWDLMPDPAEQPEPATTTSARRRLGIEERGRVIGCAGVIGAHKGVPLLLRAFERATLAPDDRLLLVGPHDPGVRSLLEGQYRALVRAGRIFSINRFVEPEVLGSSFLAMDVVCAPYPDHIGSSSIVIRAAAAGRPVLGSDFGWVGRTVARFELGWRCDVNDPERFADTIRSSLERAAAWRPGPAAERFVRFHSPENFARAWCVCLRRRLGLPPEPGALSWDWVLAATAGKDGNEIHEGQKGV